MHGKRHYACSTAATTAAQLPSRGKGGARRAFHKEISYLWEKLKFKLKLEFKLKLKIT